MRIQVGRVFLLQSYQCKKEVILQIILFWLLHHSPTQRYRVGFCNINSFCCPLEGTLQGSGPICVIYVCVCVFFLGGEGGVGGRVGEGGGGGWL